MDAKKTIEDHVSTFGEFVDLVNKIEECDNSKELSLYEKKVVNAIRALQFGHGRVFTSVNQLIANKRRQLRNKSVSDILGEKKAVESSAVTSEEVQKKKKTTSKRTTRKKKAA